MRVLLQRVREARVEVDGHIVGEIGPGLLAFLAVARHDTATQADQLLAKILNLRIFSDSEGRFHHSLQDTGGGLLIASQFTLYADTRRGRRPSFDRAAPPDQAKALYDYFLIRARERHPIVAAGVFQASMSVYLVNDGPVTLFCDADPHETLDLLERLM